MPEGLTDTLTKQEFADLVKFLSELGKVGGAYAPNKARLVRRWQVIEPNGENLNLFRRTRVSRRRRAGQPVRLVAGLLEGLRRPAARRVAEVHGVERHRGRNRVVRFQLDVTTAGAGQAEVQLRGRAVGLPREQRRSSRRPKRCST